MNPVSLLEKYFAGNPEAFETVYRHSRAVADKALDIAARYQKPGLDVGFIEEAALLHDIGISGIHAPSMYCFGKEPYIRHGIIGKDILEAEGLPRHALVCERHIGVGLTVEDIAQQKLPLPSRPMSPTTPEEQIVALADLFFSKRKGELTREKSVDEVRENLGKFGAEKVVTFNDWLNRFGLVPSI
ncbi:HD domain-containing protein [Geomesophilobacter sediminis]|uniref:HD domain-containing protein n=1 Tax=Geomesophilobacter sediminis TaxID=2798584 RepID=A0A8J7M093_9BACT|nr:HD domain-containing protein [Geomesophilobacter sediminis]MBJ6723987.1 HD domain-containing protein [Geomesophilobacter sediminis]